jgi:hypothetical protein
MSSSSSLLLCLPTRAGICSSRLIKESRRSGVYPRTDPPLSNAVHDLNRHVGVGAVSQNTRSETVTISRDKHVVLLRTSTESTENIFFLCAAAGESFLPERAVNPRNHTVLSLRGTHNPGVNITPRIEIFRYSQELDPHRQPTGGT